MNFRMNYSGLNIINKYKKEVQGKLAKTVAKNALIIEAKTKTSPNMPVDTGNLRDTIKAEATKDVMQWEVADATDYGVHQELGTSRGIVAHHFLGESCEAQANEFFNDVAEALK